jgi:hypothetical protein
MNSVKNGCRSGNATAAVARGIGTKSRVLTPARTKPLPKDGAGPTSTDDLLLVEHGKTVLSYLFNNPNAPEELSDLSRDDFIAPIQKTIFDADVDVHSAGNPVELLSVTDRLREKGQLEQVGGAAELTSISSEPCTPEIVRYALERLREAGKERRAAKIGEQLQNRQIPARQAIEQLEKLDGTVGDFPAIDDAAHLIAAEIELPPDLIEGVLHSGAKLVGRSEQEFQNLVAHRCGREYRNRLSVARFSSATWPRALH